VREQLLDGRKRSRTNHASIFRAVPITSQQFVTLTVVDSSNR
jgi:hypothetical protein